ncbi:MAG: tetratricopeptide repeat protein, partial [Magnetococcales bacterium]|nr:tetratricopeptide repeat protein [Magnetococcales bacterium]
MPSDPNTLSLEQAWIHAVEHHTAGRLGEAEQLYRAILEAAPEHADALHHLGLIAWQLNDHEQSLSLLERAIELAPNSVMFHNGLGLVLRHLGRLEEAVASLKKVLLHHPDCAEAAVNLGHTLYDLCDLPGAEAAYQQALKHQDIPGARVRLAIMTEPIPATEAQIHHRREIMLGRIQALIDDGITLSDPIMEVGLVPFYNAYHGQNDRQIQELLAKFYLQACPSLGWHNPDVDRPRDPSAKIRIAFISRHLYDHTIGKLNVGLIENLDSDRFEKIVFHIGSGAHRDPMAQRISAAADRVVELPLTLQEARLHIAEEKPDVLYYTDIGMDPFTWFLGLARLAPIQCVTWGHPVTTGSPHMDYFISSEALEIDGAEDHYSE